MTVRRATPVDQEALGRFGAALMRQHHAADPMRFLEARHPEAGYGRFLISQLSNPEALVLVAEHSGTLVGYLYAAVESTDWMALRGPAGVIHDVYVDEAARHLGGGRELMRSAIEWIRSRGRLQVVLWTKSGNEHALRLFGAMGFRATMTEMSLDLSSGST